MIGAKTRKAFCDTSVPVKLMGNVVEYPPTPLRVVRVNAVLLTPGETLPYEAFAVFPPRVVVRFHVTGKVKVVPAANGP